MPIGSAKKRKSSGEGSHPVCGKEEMADGWGVD
jgi:hypothetical protein